MSEKEVHEKVEKSVKAIKELKDLIDFEKFFEVLLQDEEIRKNIEGLEEQAEEIEKMAKKVRRAYQQLSDVGKAIVKTTLYNILFRDDELYEILGPELYDFIMNPGKYYEELLRRSVQIPQIAISGIAIPQTPNQKTIYKQEECPKCKTKVFVRYDYEKRKKILTCYNCGFISIESI